MLFSKLSTATVLALVALANASTMSRIENAGEAIPGKYIVTFKKQVSMEKVQGALEKFSRESSQQEEQTVYNINDSFKGFAAALDEQALAELKANPDVESIEEDRIFTIQADQKRPKNWGLPRIGYRHPHSLKKYVYPDEAGEGVDVYVIDTGCKPDHVEFEGRAKIGASFVNGTGIDGNGHGTHVAGTIAGKETGVAKKANIICVQVLTASGSGTLSGVISGIEYTAKQAKASGKKSVANMSLGGGNAPSLNKAVESAVESGVTFVVAAGNSDDDACSYSPASTPSAITVAASTNTDARADFSNWGKCVDVFAPGQDIYSSWADGGYKTISGTSMASPHVAGIAALYMSQGLSTPAEVAAKISKRATKNAITDNKDSANLLVYSKGMMKKPYEGMEEDADEE